MLRKDPLLVTNELRNNQMKRVWKIQHTDDIVSLNCFMQESIDSTEVLFFLSVIIILYQCN